MATIFEPKKSLFKKTRRAATKIKGNSKAGTTISFGKYGLTAIGRGRVTPKQLEAVRKVFTNYFRREIKLWIRIFPNRTFTRRADKARLGGGKGSVEHWYFNVKPERIILEISDVNFEEVKKAAKIAASKLPFKCILKIK